MLEIRKNTQRQTLRRQGLSGLLLGSTRRIVFFCGIIVISGGLGYAWYSGKLSEPPVSTHYITNSSSAVSR